MVESHGHLLHPQVQQEVAGPVLEEQAAEADQFRLPAVSAGPNKLKSLSSSGKGT